MTALDRIYDSYDQWLAANRLPNMEPGQLLDAAYT